MVKVTKFDAVQYLDSEEMMAAYLEAALEDQNPDVFLAALADVAKARGIAQLAEDTGLGRESLYKSLAPGAKPRFETIMKITKSLGVPLKVHVAKDEQRTAKNTPLV
jgi:probable addiction module antidote protein